MNYGIQTKAESIAMRAIYCLKTNKSLSAKQNLWQKDAAISLPGGS